MITLKKAPSRERSESVKLLLRYQKATILGVRLIDDGGWSLGGDNK